MKLEPSARSTTPEHGLAAARGTVVATLALTLLCGGVFPAAVWVIAQLFPQNAHGSLVVIDGTPRGSRLIGQTGTASRSAARSEPNAQRIPFANP